MVSDRASAIVDRFVLIANDVAGAFVGADAELDLANGEVLSNPIGISLQNAGLELARIQDGIDFSGEW